MWDIAMRLWLAGNYAEAAKQFLNVLSEEPTNEQAYYYVASCYDALGQESETVTYYEKAIALGINESGAYIDLGSTYRIVGHV